MKKLKLYNGRWKDHESAAYVAGYSKKDCVELLKNAGYSLMNLYDLSGWWSNAWGNSMNGITPERGVWLQKGFDKPVKIYPIEREGKCHQHYKMSL